MTQYPVWAEIDLAAIRHNLLEVKRLIKPEVIIMAVLKANAYGHGLLPLAKAVLANGAGRLAVARLDEALELRRHGIGCPILIAGYTNPHRYREVIKNNLTQTVYNLEMARDLNAVARLLGRKAKVHLEVDTGMGRLGFIPNEQALKQIEKIMTLPKLECEGIYTHFADADNTDKTYTNKQFRLFTDFLHELAQRGITFKIKHAANSAAVLDYPETHLDMVRVGIMLYGLYPSAECQKKVNLKPAMTFKARVSNVKKIPTGACVSYGCDYRAEKETVVATITLGYADGYTRILSNKAAGGEVLIHQQRAPVLGRICMDQCIVDVSAIDNVQIGDEVGIFGCQNQGYIPVEEIAKKLDTINYELVCMVAARVPRIYF